MAPTFADVLPIKILSSHQYSFELSQDWCIGIVPNGGYITSVFLIAARTHMQTTHASRHAKDPIVLHLEFFLRTMVGTAVVSVKDIKMGSRISNLHMALSQQQENGEWKVEVEGYVTITNLAKETGLSIDTSYQLHPPRLPVDLDALKKHGQDENWCLRKGELFPDFRRAVKQITMCVMRPDKRPPERPRSVMELWNRFSPDGKLGGRWTNDALGFLVDMFPQIIEQYLNTELEDLTVNEPSQAEIKDMVKSHGQNAVFWYPTLALNLDIKKLLPEEGVEWVYVRASAKSIKNGRFDIEVQVWDTDNELVAISNHSSLIVDAARNTTRGGKDARSKI